MFCGGTVYRRFWDDHCIVKIIKGKWYTKTYWTDLKWAECSENVSFVLNCILGNWNDYYYNHKYNHTLNNYVNIKKVVQYSAPL